MLRALREVADDVAAGRKAQTLARLLGAGLPVPDGFVVLPEDILDERIVDRLTTLGPGPYAVRSSSALEDGVGGSAAGLYESIIGVGAQGVLDAIAKVRASATDDAVLAYLSARGSEPQPIAVLIQPSVPDALFGIARTSPSRPSRIEERSAGSPEWSDSRAYDLAPRAADPLAQLIARVSAVLPGELDLEFARTGDHVVLLQARPAMQMRSAHAGPWPPGRWILDAEHNPNPISIAQAELVRLVEGPRFGARTRVICGYLYAREQRLGPRGTTDPSALARFVDELEPALRAQIASVRGESLEDVLGVYQAAMRRYAAQVRPALGEARRALDEILATELGTRLDDHRRLLGGTGGATSERDEALYELGREPTHDRLMDYLARFGAYAPAWDVEVPCDDEDHARVQAAAARRALGPSPAARVGLAHELANEERRLLCARMALPARALFEARLDVLRNLLTLGESDDRLFFEAQRVVRDALLERGAELVRAMRLDRVDDVFFVPFAKLSSSADLRAEVSTARAARRAAEQRIAPYRIVDGRPLLRLPDSRVVLRGRPVGGRARGRAYVVRSLTQSLEDLPDGVVLVLPAALPSLAPYLSRIAALVTEHGGALSHAATLARESGVAAVVGAAGALELPHGAELYVDGERGRVLVLA